MLIGLSSIFPCDDIEKTATYYEQVLGFCQVKYLDCLEPHICLYRDLTEIILTKVKKGKFFPNHELYGYGYDAYFYTKQPQILYDEFVKKTVKIVKSLSVTDYKNTEFVIEDIDGRWIGFGIKE